MPEQLRHLKYQQSYSVWTFRSYSHLYQMKLGNIYIQDLSWRVVTNRDMGKQNTGHVKGKNNVVENIRLHSLILCPVQYMVSFVRSVPPDATVHKVKLSSPFSKDRWVEIWPCIFSVPKSMRKTFYLDHSVSDLIADLLKQRFCKN